MAVSCLDFLLCCAIMTTDVYQCTKYCECIDITSMKPNEFMTIKSPVTRSLYIQPNYGIEGLTIMDARGTEHDPRELCVEGLDSVLTPNIDSLMQ